MKPSVEKVDSDLQAHKYYMSHPLVSSLKELSTEKLVEKLSELHRKLNFASRTNHHLANQIYFLIDDYQQEYNIRLRKESEEMVEALGGDFFSDKIDIG